MRSFFLCLLFLLFYAGSCRKPFGAESAWGIYVENKSSRNIIFLVSKNYPDTTIPDEKYKLHGVLPDQKGVYDFYERKWPDVFASLPADTLSIFIFSTDTFLIYTWPQMRNGYKILKRYDLSRQDIEGMNYTIPYP